MTRATNTGMAISRSSTTRRPTTAMAAAMTRPRHAQPAARRTPAGTPSPWAAVTVAASVGGNLFVRRMLTPFTALPDPSRPTGR